MIDILFRAVKFATLFSLTLSAVPQTSFAQGGPSEAERLIREQAQQAERERLEQGRVPLVLETQAPAIPGEEAVCFEVRDIQLTGITLLDGGAVNEAISPFARQCMGQLAIEGLIGALNNLYIEEGYITSKAYIPPQDLKTGVLQIVVVEGFIEGLALQFETTKLGQRAVERKLAAAFPTTVGDALNLRNLEQGLDQMSRMPSDSPTIDLQPGTVPGGSIVIVKSAQNDRFRGVAGMDNRGPEGAARIRLGMEVDDLLRMNDLMSLYLVGDRGSNNAVASISVPRGDLTFSLNGSYSDSVSALTDASDLTTFSSSLRFNVDYLISRGQTHKSWASLRAGKRWSERYINETELTPQDTSTLRFGYRREFRGEKSTLVGGVGVTVGGGFLGGSKNAPGTDFLTPKPEFSAIDASLSYIRPLSEKMSLYSTLNAQYSRSGVLLSDDQLGIGGWDAVRGYSGASLSADSGIVLRNEVTYLFPEFCGELCGKLRGVVQPYTFLDAGFGRNFGEDDRQAYAGLGGGLRANYKKFTAEMGIAVPLIETELRTDRVPDLLLNVTWKLF